MTVQVPMVDADGITAALPWDACIDVMADALRALDRGHTIQPLRSVIRLPDDAGTLYTMPAFIAEPRALTVKMITVFHGNEQRGLPSHQGIVAVFDPVTGAPALLLDAASLTAIRTAAVSAAATRALAREDASVLAVLGTGVQAESHIVAMQRVRPIRDIRIWGRNSAHAEALARRAPATNAAVTVCATAEEAVTGADIICTTTSASEPVLHGTWLKAGAHVNAVGSSSPGARELDSAAVSVARVFVDDMDAALAEAGDLLIPLAEGVTRAEQWTPIGRVLNGAAGRVHADDITLFESVGLAIEDAAAAAYIAQRLAASRGA